MWPIALAVVFALVLWWSSTVLVMYLDGLRNATHRWSLLAAGATGVLAIVALAETADDSGVAAAYQAFVAALAVWGANELAFLTGFVTGPRREGCSEQCRGWARFRHAFAAIAYHELALLASMAIVVAVTWQGVNATGSMTFAALWVMRLSSKLNLFLGVPNVGAELLPDDLAYLGRYFRRGPVNPLFPVSVTALTVAAAHLIYEAIAASTPGERTAFVLLAALVALGTLEHWLMAVPLRPETLWRAGLRSRRRSPAPGPAPSGGDLAAMPSQPLPAAGRHP